LRDHLEVEPVPAFDREADPHVLAIHLRLAEELVLVRKSARKLGRAKAHRRVAVRRELEALAVHVVAVGDGEGHFDARGVECPRREAERFLGLEKIVRAAAELELRRRRSGERKCKQKGDDALQVLVSAATQSKYAGRPRSIGTAMISGSS